LTRIPLSVGKTWSLNRSLGTATVTPRPDARRHFFDSSDHRTALDEVVTSSAYSSQFAPRCSGEMRLNTILSFTCLYQVVTALQLDIDNSGKDHGLGD
jgi:hypothetical protein